MNLEVLNAIASPDRLEGSHADPRRPVRQQPFLQDQLEVCGLSGCRAAQLVSPLKGTPEQLAAAARFKAKVSKLLPPPAQMTPERLRAIKDMVDQQFDQQNDGFVINYGMRRLVDGLELIPDLIDFIDADMEAVIENYYGSHFKIFAMTCYRTMPTPDKPDFELPLASRQLPEAGNQADGLFG